MPTRLDATLAAHGEQMLQAYPQLATALGLDTGERQALKHALNDRSAEAAARDAAMCAARLADLAGDADSINGATARYANQLGVEGGKFGFGDNSLMSIMDESVTPYLVTPRTGVAATIPEFLDSQHKIESEDDAAAYLDRLAALGPALDQETDRIRRDAGNGVIPPDFILAPTIALLQNFQTDTLVHALATRITAFPDQDERVARATRIVEQGVAPAIGRQRDALSALAPKAGSAAGVWALPDGDAYYAWTIKMGTSSSLGAQEVHAIGLDEVEKITAEMDLLLRRRGQTEGSVGARMAAMAQDPAFRFADSDAGRAALIDYLNDRVAAARDKIAAVSRLSLRAAVAVQRVPVEAELGQLLGYMSVGPGDGSRPSIYYINLRDMAFWPRFTLPSLTYHETLPGHVWQGAAVGESRHLPLFSRMLGFNGYVEGWAVYAEQLADEIGLYDGDLPGRLGYLQFQLLRACRLVADTGLHALRWTRAATVHWLVAATGYPVGAVAQEVDRYCATPGQACGYKIGQIQILRMREKARAALGRRFDLPGFNDALLTAGNVPLTVLEQVVDGYVARTA